jgi:HEAT repeat protein
VNNNCKTVADLNQAAISLIELGVPAKQVFLKAGREVKGDTTWFISALKLIGGKECTPVLLQILGDPLSTDLVRQRSADALLEMDANALVQNLPLLIKAMQKTENEECLTGLAKVLASTGSPEASKAILAAFNKTDNPYFKIELADVLAGLHYKEASAALIKFENEINNAKDGHLSGNTHFADSQIQDMKKRIRAAITRLGK